MNSIQFHVRNTAIAFAAVLALSLEACAPPPEPTIRKATPQECFDGGTALEIDGRLESLACTEPSAPGGAIVVGQAQCSAGVDDILATISASIWALADGSMLGFCTITEVRSAHTDVSPIIGDQCLLSSYDGGGDGIVTIDFRDFGAPPAITGAIIGQLDCVAFDGAP
jgi:hypothetical protein